MKKIKLTRGKHTIVDCDDYAKYGHLKWCYNSSGYAIRRRAMGGGKLDYLHRLIMSPLHGQEVDHKNGDRLDNRKSNLRVCTPSQNQSNRPVGRKSKSGYKGVWMVPEYVNKSNKWCAMIKKGGKHKNLGYFKTPRLAAIAYNKAAKEIHGEFAWTNKLK